MSAAHRRPRAWQRLGVLLAVVVVSSAVAVTTGSSAIFTSASGNGISTVQGGDWVPPTVSLTDPGTVVQGSVTLQAQATDGPGSGVKQVVIQRRPVGSPTWTNICTGQTTPYSCAWNTTTVSDGSYELRAVATDNVNLTSTSAVATTTVVNTASRITLDSLASPLKGTVTLSATVSPYPVVFSVRFEYRPDGAGNWKTACTTIGVVGMKPSCLWDTTRAGNGPHEVRAVLVPLLGPEVASASMRVVLAGGPGAQTFSMQTFSAPELRTAPEPSSPAPDPTKPAVPDAAPAPTPTPIQPVQPSEPIALDDPGTELTGLVPLTVTVARDAQLELVAVQARPAGDTDAEWSGICTPESLPEECTWDTTTWAPGSYDLRAVAITPYGDPVVSEVLLDRRLVERALVGSEEDE